MKLYRTVGVAAGVAVVLSASVSISASARPPRPHLELQTLEAFIDENGLGAAQESNPGMSRARIAAAADDSAAHVDRFGNLVWIDEKLPQSILGSPNRIATNVLSISADDFLSLNSRPGSQRTIFLDFDGHTVPTGTAWGDSVAGNYPAFTIDGDPSFNNDEKNYIIQAWGAVADDYAMFDVNVTTQDPGDAAINRTNASDAVYGTRALITQGISAWDSDVCVCGGIAFGNVFKLNIQMGFEHSYGQPAFIFTSSDYLSSSTFDGKLLADVASHEVGHNLNLDHDGNDVDGEYFQGIGDGLNWAPIMGAGYYNGIVQWSNGDYLDATNPEDDLALISAAGTPILSDESNVSVSTAFDISATPTDGVITGASDTDYFRVVVENGSLGLSSYSPTPLGNLDTQLSLYDRNGKLLFSTDPLTDQSEFDSGPEAGMAPWPPTGMDGILDADLPNGTYYVRIDGVGRTGSYSDYGSVGAYSIKTQVPTVSSITTKGTPTISGTRRKGHKLTANYGTWSSGVSISKRWLRDGLPITGATGKYYTLTKSDVGHKISVRLVVTKTDKRTAVVYSAKTRKITN